MSAFLRTFLIFLRFFGRPIRKVDWTDADSAGLRAFLQGSVGKKLIGSFREMEAHQNASAVLTKDRHEYACGFAAGFRAALAWAISLSVISTPQAAELNDDQPSTEAELLESLSG